MKPLKTKAQIRNEINRQIDDFLNSGGEVNEVPRGTSGNLANENLFAKTTSDSAPQTRTPVTEVVQALEARKKSKHAKPVTTRNRKPKKKLITDDFGEPVRWVWED